MGKYDEVTRGQEEAVYNKLGGMTGLQRFLADELIVVEKARKVSPDGLTNGGITYASAVNVSMFVEDWQKFHHDALGVAIDLSKVPLPPVTSGFSWGVAVVPGITLERVFDRSSSSFRRWSYWDDLDQAIRTNVRAAGEPYIVWARDRVEADEELKNFSALQLEERGINCMTLHERLLLERWFYWESNGGHLDVKNVTLCAGSRMGDGRVPFVRWSDAGLRVDRSGPGGAYQSLRARQVVSLAPAEVGA